MAMAIPAAAFFLALLAHIALRLLYFAYIGGVLQRKAAHPPEAPQPEEWRAFRRKAAFVLCMDLATFLAATALSAGTLFPDAAVTSARAAVTALGAALAAVGVAVKVGAYRVIGQEGWFWYDFFRPPRDVQYVRRGVYRHLAHPMYGVGYLSILGIAVALQSGPGIALALFDWAVVAAFYFRFERRRR